MLSLRQLRYFVAIIDAGSVSRAATVLHIAQPALSQQLAHLESEIGTKLLRRSVRGMAPTGAGSAVYRHAQTLLKLCAETANVARGAGSGASGRVRIGMPSSIAMILVATMRGPQRQPGSESSSQRRQLMIFARSLFGAMQLMLFAAVLAAGAPAVATAQTARYPDKPVRVVVTNPPGGIVDIVARMVAQKLAESLGQPFIVETRAGASGTIAAAMVAKAPADGSVLLMAPPTPIVMAPSLYKALTYDPLKNLAAVSEIAYAPLVLVVNPALPVKSVGELVALAKTKPGELSYGSGGLGSGPHVTGAMLSSRAGIELTHVPYKGEAPAVADLLGGQLQMVFANLPAAGPHMKSGRLRALAVTSLQRMPSAPELPTMAEAGLPDFEAVTWVGMFAPEGTPREIVARLNAAVVRMLADTESINQFTGHGLTIVGNSPEQFSAYIRAEIPLWAKVLKSVGVEPQ